MILRWIKKKKKNYNDKARSLARKGSGTKAHVSQKIVLYLKGVTINIENYSQRSRSLHLRDKLHKQFSTPHNTYTKFYFREVKITAEGYKILLYIKKKNYYNQQSRSSHRLEPSQGEKERKEERENEGEGEREKRGERNNGESGT